jgi:hypothetical protein
MTIDSQIFAQATKELGEWYGKTFTPFVLRIYWAYLSEKLTDEELLSACEQAVTKSQWMPTPEQLHEFAKGASDLRLQADWDKCLSQASDTSTSLPTYYIIEDNNLSDVAKYALKAVGGIRGIANCKPQDLPFLRKAFNEAYKDYQSKNTNAIANKKLLEESNGLSVRA